MHMADALLSPAVGGVMAAVSVGSMAYAVKKIGSGESMEKEVPLMGVMGAFVFGAQMINFTIPATGSSGHIGGGILLAAVLGPYPALLAIVAVLIIQCLFFADGGILALGCNIFNMGVIPCLLAYPLCYKPIVRGELNERKISFGAVMAVIVGLQFGSLCVVLQTVASGITELPFGAFLMMMQPIHLAIGIVEGLITAAALCVLYHMRPELITNAAHRLQQGRGGSLKKVIAVIAIVTVLIAGGFSLFASDNPDGLEWSIENVAGTADLPLRQGIHKNLAEAQEKIAFMPDYAYSSKEEGGTSLAGLVGGGLTLLLATGVCGLIRNISKRRRSSVEAHQDR